MPSSADPIACIRKSPAVVIAKSGLTVSGGRSPSTTRRSLVRRGAPKTLDKTLDAMHERYGIATPFADYMYSSPAKALIADTTTGGWVGRETVAGQETDHL